MTKIKIFFGIGLVGLIFLVLLLAPDFIKYRGVVRATAAFPYEVGIMNAIVVQCTPVTPPGICTGMGLCSTLTVAQCALHSDVSGMQAGGMGSDVLLSQTTIGQIGLAAGGSVIAAGLSPTLMDGGPAASMGGATLGLMRYVDKILTWFERIV